ncbi:thioredoxin [Jiangella alkaliphila]|uniref:Thioredoxin n=1 Tax=Jiangella alkaliphila TaxID=419479 RepID=A0A1H2L7X4_9ACTN|nr:thioredoxin family protein [Jiangella alkaliphila]SDU76546.1 thioredoxin [Jiangella alkaliphila]
MVREISPSDFDDVTASRGPVVVEFYATWCGACRRMTPVLDAVAAELAGQVEFVKVNVDEATELVSRYDVRSTPTLLVFKDGSPIGAPLVGAYPEVTVREAITASLVPTAPSTAALLAWVPDDACTLPTAERPFRLDEFADLFATSLHGLERPTATRLVFSLDEAAEGRARDLAARESSCCSFFTFTFRAPVDGTVQLQVDVPAERGSVLDGLAHQATTAAAANL